MEKIDLWPAIERLIREVERPSRYIGDEWGCKKGNLDDFSFCMIYPDTYELGQPNQAIRILVNRINAQDGMRAERSFLPAVDMISLMRQEDLPLFSLENMLPVASFDVVGITLPHELCATNILEVLDLAKIPVRSSDRSQEDPIVIAGGPCAYNPEPYHLFFDAILIGEGEEQIVDVMKVVKEQRNAGSSREDILKSLSRIEGVYIPSFYDLPASVPESGKDSCVSPINDDVPSVIKKRVYNGFSDSSGMEDVTVPYIEAVHDRLNVEILRGCARGCRFCQAGMIYRPVRERSVKNIVDSVIRGLNDSGYEEVSLTSLSTTDHSGISNILCDLNRELSGKGVKVSIPSQRLDSFGVEMACMVAGNKRGGLTFAPEAGTQRLRDVINKNVTEDDLFSAIDAALDSGWRRCKLYFMIGLPTETDEDVRGIGYLVQKVYDRMRDKVQPSERGSLTLTVSVAVFVPKSQTPFQWDGQILPEEAKRRVGLIKDCVKSRAIRISYHEPRTSFIEAVMSRGGREISFLVEQAWRNGARFDAWSELFDADAWNSAATLLGINMEEVASANYEIGSPMPFDHISCGVDRGYLIHERQLADRGMTTQDCTYYTCTNCRVCMDLNAKNRLDSERCPKALETTPSKTHRYDSE